MMEIVAVMNKLNMGHKIEAVDRFWMVLVDLCFISWVIIFYVPVYFCNQNCWVGAGTGPKNLFA